MQNLKFQFKIKNYFTFLLWLYLIILPRPIQAQAGLAEIISSSQTNEPLAESLAIEPPRATETAAESPKTILIIDEATAKKGYPAQSPDKNLTLVLYPNVLASNLKVEVEEKNTNGNLPPDVNLLGKIYTFKLSLDSHPVVLSKFFPLVINFTGNNQDELSGSENQNQPGRKALYSFLTPQNKWIALKSKITPDKAVALIDFSQATVAVFFAQDQASLPPEIQIAAADNSKQNMDNANNGGREQSNQDIKIVSDSVENSVQEQKFTIYLGDDIIEKGYTVSYPVESSRQPPANLVDSVNLSAGSEKQVVAQTADNKAIDSQIVETPSAEFKISILPKILTKSVNLQIKKYSKDDFPALPVDDENYQIMTDIYEYDFQSALVKLEKDKNLILEINSLPANQYNKKSVFFLDETINKWRPLPSKYNLKQNSIRAFTYFPYAKIAVFKKQNVKIGQASWFADRLSSAAFGAASNDFSRNTVLKVKNLANNKSVEVKVVSSGPFVKDRIIDLTYSAFSMIASPKQGVIEVEAEKLID